MKLRERAAFDEDLLPIAISFQRNRNDHRLWTSLCFDDSHAPFPLRDLGGPNKVSATKTTVGGSLLDAIGESI